MNVDVVTDVDTMGPAVTVKGVANPNSERVVSMYGDKSWLVEEVSVKYHVTSLLNVDKFVHVVVAIMVSVIAALL